jgi:hypothetical protein
MRRTFSTTLHKEMENIDDDAFSDTVGEEPYYPETARIHVATTRSGRKVFSTQRLVVVMDATDTSPLKEDDYTSLRSQESEEEEEDDDDDDSMITASEQEEEEWNSESYVDSGEEEEEDEEEDCSGSDKDEEDSSLHEEEHKEKENQDETPAMEESTVVSVEEDKEMDAIWNEIWSTLQEDPLMQDNHLE